MSDATPNTAHAQQARRLAVGAERALEQIFRGGGSTVYAVRVANLAAGVTMQLMSWAVNSGAAADPLLFTLTAVSPGTWANAIVASCSAANGGQAPTLTLTSRLATRDRMVDWSARRATAEDAASLRPHLQPTELLPLATPGWPMGLPEPGAALDEARSELGWLAEGK